MEEPWLALPVKEEFSKARCGYHRIPAWQGLEGTFGITQPNPLPKQGHPEQAAQHRGQAGLEYLQRRRLHSLPGQPGPGLRHPQREEVLPRVQLELPLLHFVDWIEELCPILPSLRCCLRVWSRWSRSSLASESAPALLSPDRNLEELRFRQQSSRKIFIDRKGIWSPPTLWQNNCPFPEDTCLAAAKRSSAQWVYFSSASIRCGMSWICRVI